MQRGTVNETVNELAPPELWISEVVHAGWELQDLPWSYPTGQHIRTTPDIAYDSNESKYMRSLPFHWLILVAEGSLSVAAFGSRLQAEQGSCVHIGPHVPHHLDVSRSAKYLWVHFHLHGRGAQDLGWRPVHLELPSLMRPADISSLRKHWLSLLEECTVQATGYRMAANARLSLILSELLRELHDKRGVHPAWQMKDETIAKALEHIHQNYRGKLSVDRLAQLANLSPNYFISRFGQVTGLPPGKYILLVRIGQARHLLRATDQPLADIAERSGFESLAHFSRTFKQYEGVSPSQFRRQF